jgi:hypothetical protein
VIHAHGTRYDDALVVLKLSQFVERHTPKGGGPPCRPM